MNRGEKEEKAHGKVHGSRGGERATRNGGNICMYACGPSNSALAIRWFWVGLGLGGVE